MFECKIENSKGNVLTLTQNQTDYQVYKIDGLNPPKAQINLSAMAGQDGARFNSSKLETRNIVIYIKLNNDVEQNRIMLYKYFTTKEWCKFYYKNSNRSVYIECRVETCEVTPFSNNEIMQISLICPQPYFKDMGEILTDISKALAAFKFPFSINATEPIPFSTIDTSRITNVYNDSETETGLMINLNILGTINKIQIKNTSTGETFTINYNFIANDKITIDTNKGQKSIKLIRNAVVTNIFTAVAKGSKFFQLQIGDNLFSYSANNGTSDDLLQISFKHYNIYRGV